MCQKTHGYKYLEVHEQAHAELVLWTLQKVSSIGHQGRRVTSTREGGEAYSFCSYDGGLSVLQESLEVLRNEGRQFITLQRKV